MNYRSTLHRMPALMCVSAAILATCLTASAEPNVAKLVPGIARSIVVVQYTAENEFHKTNKVSGQGIVLNKKGVVLVSSTVRPRY